MAAPPTFAQELFVARLRAQWAFDMIRIQPTLATVLRSGGTGLIVVRPDGAPTDTEQTIPFLAGTRYASGQRIVTVPTQGGAPVAIGVVPTSTSQYAVIGTEHIVPGSITAALLAAGAISYSSLDVDTQGRISQAATDASTALNKANSVQGTASTALSAANAASTTANTAQTAASAAQSTASTALTEANRANNRISNLNLTVAAGSIGEAQLASSAVTGQKIRDGAVMPRHLDFTSLRQPINQIPKINERIVKLCKDAFGNSNCGVSG